MGGVAPVADLKAGVQKVAVPCLKSHPQEGAAQRSTAPSPESLWTQVLSSDGDALCPSSGFSANSPTSINSTEETIRSELGCAPNTPALVARGSGSHPVGSAGANRLTCPSSRPSPGPGLTLLPCPSPGRSLAAKDQERQASRGFSGSAPLPSPPTWTASSLLHVCSGGLAHLFHSALLPSGGTNCRAGLGEGRGRGVGRKPGQQDRCSAQWAGGLAPSSPPGLRTPDPTTGLGLPTSWTTRLPSSPSMRLERSRTPVLQSGQGRQTIASPRCQAVTRAVEGASRAERA